MLLAYSPMYWINTFADFTVVGSLLVLYFSFSVMPNTENALEKGEMEITYMEEVSAETVYADFGISHRL